ncbi:MAG: peptidase [Bacteroidetes bacterium]|nr:peptidase [Bacteroidota bacterium]
MRLLPFQAIGTLIVVLGGALLIGCDSGSVIDDDTVAGVSLAELFRAPSQSELAQVEGDWASRTAEPANVRVVHEASLALAGTPATLKIVSHSVGGVTHYGGVLSPDGAAVGSLPVVVYSHGGDNGVSIDQEVLLVLAFFPDIADEFVYVIRSFRSERLRYGGEEWTSDGPPSPWDYDVDDALTLINVASEIEPAADLSRIAVVGFSRGAGVGMLMAVRDPRIDSVIEFFGPTDFFGPFVQSVVEETLMGNPRDLPGLAYLNRTFILPLQSGSISMDTARLELIRRSPILFAERLPDLQIHHGTADTIVPVTQAERLISVMQSLGRMAPSFESYLYDGGQHNPLTLTGSLERASEFLSRLLQN